MTRVAIVLSVALILAACDANPVTWTDPVSTAVPDSMSRLAVSGAGDVAWIADTGAAAHIPASAGECGSSVRWARAGRDMYAASWVVRPDSTARMIVVASHDGGRTWAPAVVVDTADVGKRGCDRPPPSIAATGADVHVVYSMRSSEGTGVFLAHSMDRGAMFHAPIPVSYGDRLVEAAVSAEGSLVAVAYEDPSGASGAVRLALSRSQGHILEVHMPASRSVDEAASPRVALAEGGRRVAVAWIARERRGGGGSAIVRVGTIEH